MGDVLALIPARVGSKGIPGKNFRMLGAKPLYQYAVECAIRSGCTPVVSSDRSELARDIFCSPARADFYAITLFRPPALVRDDTPMIDVVQHALAQIPGPPEQIIVLLQPTQPLRRPEHVRMAIDRLIDTQADSIVGVVPVHPAAHAYWQAFIDREGRLDHAWDARTRRQQLPPSYRRDGTVYAFWRRTVHVFGTIYGEDCRPLIIDPRDSCELDTEADWIALERRWKERDGAIGL